MQKKTEKEFLMTEAGGFYFGRLKADGTMSADTVRVEDEQVVKLVAAWFERQCRREKTDTQVINNPTGAIIIKQVSQEDLEKMADMARQMLEKQLSGDSKSKPAAPEALPKRKRARKKKE